MESTVFALMCLFIGCFVIGLLLPQKEKKEVGLPFEVVVRARTPVVQPKVIVKEVIRYVDRPRKNTPIQTTNTKPVLSPPTTPTPVYTPPIIKKRVESPVNKTAFAEAKQSVNLTRSPC